MIFEIGLKFAATTKFNVRIDFSLFNISQTYGDLNRFVKFTFLKIETTLEFYRIR